MNIDDGANRSSQLQELLEEWSVLGVRDIERLQAWIATGMSPTEAAAWSAEPVLDASGDWHDGFSVAGMRAWTGRGFTASQARAWCELVELDEAAMWHGFGWSIEDTSRLLIALDEQDQERTLGLVWAATRLPVDVVISCVHAGLWPHEAGTTGEPVDAAAIRTLVALRGTADRVAPQTIASYPGNGDPWAVSSPT